MQHFHLGTDRAVTPGIDYTMTERSARTPSLRLHHRSNDDTSPSQGSEIINAIHTQVVQSYETWYSR
jgi:hypothetical protein